MDVFVLFKQLSNVARAPVYANAAGNPLELLCGEGSLPRGGLSLADWPFGEGLPRSPRGQLSPEPGAGPDAPVGISLTPLEMPGTGYVYPLPERYSGSIVSASS